MADFQKWSSKFESEKVRVIAASTDPLEKAQEIIEKVGITFPVAHSLNAVEISSKTGAFYERNKMHLHATGFLLRPDNFIDVACYSSNHVGRLTAKDLYGLILYYRKQRENQLKTLS